MSPVEDEVVGPNVVAMQRPQPNTGTIVAPEPSPFRLLAWHTQPFSAPQSLHAFVIYPPPFLPKQCRNTAISISPEPRRQGHNTSDKLLFISPQRGPITLCGSWLGQQYTHSTLTDVVLGLGVCDRKPATLRA
jgi:hypothetical protein